MKKEPIGINLNNEVPFTKAEFLLAHAAAFGGKNLDETTRMFDDFANQKEADGDLCVRCGLPIDHNDPHMYCSKCT